MTRAEAAAIARAHRKIAPLPTRFWSKVDRRGPDECWPWLACVRKPSEGYGAFWYKRRHRPSTHIAWLLEHGSLPKKPNQVLHSCDNPNCVNPAHLFIGTNVDNNEDKVRKGRHVFGERSGSSKLTDAQVIDIRSKAKTFPKNGCSNIAILAANHGITTGHVYDILNRKCWRHL